MEDQAPIAAPAAVRAVLQGVEDELAPNPPAPNAPARTLQRQLHKSLRYLFLVCLNFCRKFAKLILGVWSPGRAFCSNVVFPCFAFLGIAVNLILVTGSQVLFF